jgi:hypothetical protein
MRVLLFVAYLIVTPINWLFMHLSGWLMNAHSYIVMELMKRTKMKE